MARRPIPDASPLTQWVVAAIGLVVTLGAVGLMVFELFQQERPPTLIPRIVEVQATPAGYVAEVEVRNDGSDTAAGVELEGVQGPVTASATLDYVPGRGSATAFLRFPADPRTAPPALSIKGWSAP